MADCPAEAERVFRRSWPLLEQNLRELPTGRDADDWWEGYGASTQKLAESLRALGRSDDAAEVEGHSEELAAKLAGQFPETLPNEVWCLRLLVSHYLRHAGPNEVAVAYGSFLKVADGLVQRSAADPANPELLGEVAASHARFAQAFKKVGLVGKAEAAYRQAAAQFTEASRRNPGTMSFAAWRAYTVLAVGDHDGYRRACADMKQRFAQLEDPHGTNTLVYTCVLAPAAVADLDALVRLAEQANAKRPRDWYYLQTLGAILYRAGRCEDALRTLNEACAAHGKGGNAYNWFVMAMAHHGLGHAGQARDWLSRAVEWHEQANRNAVQDPLTALPLSWTDRLTLELFRREAEELILRNPAPEAEKDKTGEGRSRPRESTTSNF